MVYRGAFSIFHYYHNYSRKGYGCAEHFKYSVWDIVEYFLYKQAGDWDGGNDYGRKDSRVGCLYAVSFTYKIYERFKEGHEDKVFYILSGYALQFACKFGECKQQCARNGKPYEKECENRYAFLDYVICPYKRESPQYN